MSIGILALAPAFSLIALWQTGKRNYFFAGLAHAAAAVPFMLVDGANFGPLVLAFGLFAGVTWGNLPKKETDE